jgi:hypothetical protein
MGDQWFGAPSGVDEWFAAPLLDPVPRPGRFATPTGGPCPRSVATNGDVTATADCHGCGFCLLLFEAAFGPDPGHGPDPG